MQQHQDTDAHGDPDFVMSKAFAWHQRGGLMMPGACWPQTLVMIIPQAKGGGLGGSERVVRQGRLALDRWLPVSSMGRR